MSRAMREVVITATSVFSALGAGEEFSRRLLSGECGISDIRGRIVPADFPIRHAALADPAKMGFPALAESNLAGERRAMQKFLLDGLSTHGLSELSGAIIGTNDSGPKPPDTEAFARLGIAAQRITNMDSAVSSAEFKAELEGRGIRLKGEVTPFYNTCVSGITSMGQAFERIATGRWETALVGAYESRIRPWLLLSYGLLGVISEESCLPSLAGKSFRKDRQGFIKAEGGALFLLESAESARARGAEILAYVRGYGFTTDAFDLTDSVAGMRPAQESMRQAMQQAGIEPGQINYINAHGSGTRLNDAQEISALDRVFGPALARIPISSQKPQLGHANIACAAIELAGCLASLKTQTLLPTLNCDPENAAFPYDFVPDFQRPAKLRYLLKNSFGFGGLNASIVLERA